MTDVSVGFRPPCWYPAVWAPTWRLHTNHSKFGGKASLHILHKKSCCYLNLGASLCIVTFFLFSDSGLNLLNGFDFYFDLFWMAWHWKPAISSKYSIFQISVLCNACSKTLAQTTLQNIKLGFRMTCDETKGVTQTRKPDGVTCRKPILTNPAQFLVQILAWFLTWILARILAQILARILARILCLCILVATFF